LNALGAAAAIWSGSMISLESWWWLQSLSVIGMLPTDLLIDSELVAIGLNTLWSARRMFCSGSCFTW